VLSRLGLRSRMAASYVLVSAAAVLIVEAVVLSIMVPRLRTADETARQAEQRAAEAELQISQLKAQSLARSLAIAVSEAAGGPAVGGQADSDNRILAAAERALAPSAARTSQAESLVQVLTSTDGRVIAANPVRAYPANSTLPHATRAPAPQDGQWDDNGTTRFWSTAPIQIAVGNGGGTRTIGIAYVELSAPQTDQDSAAGAGSDTGKDPRATTAPGDAVKPTGPAEQDTTIGSVLLPGIVALLLLIPVGTVFGLISTGRMIQRIRRLAEATSAMAEGNLQVLIPVSGADEVARLEQAFNVMAGRLDAAIAEQRAASGAEARRAERARIARELHDSISQELFAVHMVAAGMRKALPAVSPLREQAESMEQSLVRTMRQMRALLLELRPFQLQDEELTVALQSLCRAYEARLGIRVSADLQPVTLDPPLEHALLLIVQEAVGNAIRHSDPSAVDLRLVTVDGRVEVTVRDDGSGFDVSGAAGRHGMGLDLMRERVREFGGTLDIDSAPEQGTTVRVSLPGRADAPAL
jgi:signal transduction histidine kinase